MPRHARLVAGVRSVRVAEAHQASTSPRLHSGGRSNGQSVVEFALVFPIMVVLLFAIVDFARIYTTMVNVESAAREAADYGTELGAAHWSSATVATTVSEMERRACVATSNLPDYSPRPAPGDPISTCTNPAFSCTITDPTSGTTYTPCDSVDPAAGCDNSVRPSPCQITVTLTYDFHLLAPFHIEFFGLQFGFPSDIPVERDSTFSITDITLTPSAGPSASPSAS